MRPGSDVVYKHRAQTLRRRASEHTQASKNTALTDWQIPQETVVSHVSLRKRTRNKGSRGRVGGKVKTADRASVTDRESSKAGAVWRVL